MRAGRAPRPPVLGGASPPASYSLITGWGALNDADSHADAGSGMSAGTWTLVTKAAYLTQIDGYQENFSGYDVPLTTLYPDWNDATDRLDLCLEVAAMPMNTTKWGFAAFVGDNTYANRATMIAKGMYLCPNGTTTYQTSEVGATANASVANNGTNTNAVLQLFTSTTWDATRVARVIARTKRATDEGECVILGSPGSAMGVAANRRVYFAAMKSSALGIAQTISARLYHRRIRATSAFV